MPWKLTQQERRSSYKVLTFSTPKQHTKQITFRPLSRKKRSTNRPHSVHVIHTNRPRLATEGRTDGRTGRNGCCPAHRLPRRVAQRRKVGMFSYHFLFTFRQARWVLPPPDVHPARSHQTFVVGVETLAHTKGAQTFLNRTKGFPREAVKSITG